MSLKKWSRYRESPLRLSSDKHHILNNNALPNRAYPNKSWRVNRSATRRIKAQSRL